MSYADRLALVLDQHTLVALTDDSNAGVVNGAVISEALAAAEREVRSLLSVTSAPWANPLSEAQIDIVVTLTVERLYDRRREVLPGPWSERAARGRVALSQMRRAAQGAEVYSLEVAEPLHRVSKLKAL